MNLDRPGNGTQNQKVVPIFLRWMVVVPTVLCLWSCVPKVPGSGGPGRVVEYTSMWTENEPQARYMASTARAFEAQTGIRVSIRFLGRDVLTKIHSRLLMGDCPDLVDQDFTELSAAFLRDETPQAETLDDFYYHSPGPEGQPRMMDLFREDLVRLYAVGGHLYFYPYEFVTSGFFYSRKLFEDNGLGAPDTWDDFLGVNRILASRGIPALALDGNINFYNAYYYVGALDRLAGSGHLREASQDRTGETWRGPDFLVAARMISDLGARGERFFQTGYDSAIWPEAQSHWARGEAGSLLCGTWIPSETQTLVPPWFRIGLYPFPRVAGGRGDPSSLEAMFFGFAVPRGARNSRDALEFLRFLGRKDNADNLARTTLNVSPRRDAVYPQDLRDLKPLVDGARSFRLPYDGVLQSNPRWFTTVFYPLDNDLLFGRIDPITFVRKMEAATKEYWKVPR